MRQSLYEVLNGFEPMIRELQSHALPLGYSTICAVPALREWCPVTAKQLQNQHSLAMLANVAVS